MYNSKAPIYNNAFMVTMHGTEALKASPFQLPSNVRVIMLCKPILCYRETTLFYEFICNANLKTYQKLLEKLISNRITKGRLCVFDPSSTINQMRLSGKYDYDKYNLGVYEIGQNVRVTNTDKKISCSEIGKYLSGDSDEKYRVENDGIIRTCDSDYRILLSEMIDELLVSHPGGFTLLIISCRGRVRADAMNFEVYGQDVFPYLPKGKTLRRAYKLYKKYMYSQTTSLSDFRRINVLKRGAKKQRL